MTPGSKLVVNFRCCQIINNKEFYFNLFYKISKFFVSKRMVYAFFVCPKWSIHSYWTGTHLQRSCCTDSSAPDDRWGRSWAWPRPSKPHSPACGAHSASHSSDQSSAWTSHGWPNSPHHSAATATASVWSRACASSCSLRPANYLELFQIIRNYFKSIQIILNYFKLFQIITNHFKLFRII